MRSVFTGEDISSSAEPETKFEGYLGKLIEIPK